MHSIIAALSTPSSFVVQFPLTTGKHLIILLGSDKLAFLADEHKAKGSESRPGQRGSDRGAGSRARQEAPSALSGRQN